VTAFDPGFSTAAMTALFSADSRVQAMCRFEAALAGAEADVGLIPPSAAAEIERACAARLTDAESLLAAGWDTGTPVVVLLERLRAALSPEAARLIHLGATTQDVVDSTLMAQIRDGLQLLEKDVKRIAVTLRSLAIDHRETLMIGRTFLQHAQPTTFGLRAAFWLEPLLRQLTELRAAAANLPVQMGGPVGNQATLGEHAAAIAAGVAERLGLTVPVVPWHTDRSRLTEVVALVSRIAGSAAKIGGDLAQLSQSEIGEIRIRPGASSTMAGKRNPIDAVRAVAAFQACAATAQIVTAAPPHELERGIGPWHAEWFAVPVVFQTGAAAVEAVGSATESIEVDVARMATNLGVAAQPAMLAAAGALVDRVLEAADASGIE
jgi:3-carboxy-cis,cis-muconate cycloisomerase